MIHKYVQITITETRAGSTAKVVGNGKQINKQSKRHLLNIASRIQQTQDETRIKLNASSALQLQRYLKLKVGYHILLHRYPQGS